MPESVKGCVVAVLPEGVALKQLALISASFCPSLPLIHLSHHRCQCVFVYVSCPLPPFPHRGVPSSATKRECWRRTRNQQTYLSVFFVTFLVPFSTFVVPMVPMLFPFLISSACFPICFFSFFTRTSDTPFLLARRVLVICVGEKRVELSS